MTIKPLGNRILVKPIEIETTKSGIVLPDSMKEKKPTMSEIVGIGDGENVSNFTIGKILIHAKYAGVPITNDDIKYLILRDEECLAIMD